jgi:hypothetical protein
MKIPKIISTVAAVLALSVTNVVLAAEDHKGQDHDANKGAEKATRLPST